jgi:hypothetical protein
MHGIMHVPCLGAITPAGNIRRNEANALQYRRFNSNICLSAVCHSAINLHWSCRARYNRRQDNRHCPRWLHPIHFPLYRLPCHRDGQNILVRYSSPLHVHGLNEPVPETGPSGQIYFFNTFTRESTYVRPLPVFPATAPQKEKPKIKTPIPGTDWLRVTTNQGNVFYTNKAKKESVWTIPDEIKDAVELLNKQEENDDQIRAGEQAQEETRRDVEIEQEREIERVRMELQEAVKRKAEDISQSDEIVISKKPRVEDQVGDKVDEADDTDDGEESEEEDWQREAAAQLAKEAEEEEQRQREEDEKAKSEEAQRAKESAPQITMPDRVDLSIEEGKALFKVCLQRNISPVPFKLTRCMYRPYSGRKT